MEPFHSAGPEDRHCCGRRRSAHPEPGNAFERKKMSIPLRTPQTPENGAVSPFRRWAKGGLLAGIGYILSPFSWWNDLYVNLPIAYVVAWCVSRFDRALFESSFIAAYWLTNLAGLLLLHSGMREALGGEKHDPERRHRQEILIDILVSLIYTVLVLALFKSGVLKPIEPGSLIHSG